MEQILTILAKEFGLGERQVEKTVELIEGGNTIPFIARYRKEVTGGLSDTVLRELDERLAYLKNLSERKDEVIRLISEQGKLTPELEREIEAAEVLQRVEDLYKPYKKKKATRASKARERGLEPLARIILAQGNPAKLKTLEIFSGDTEGSFNLLTPEEVANANTLREIATPFVNHESGVENWEDAIRGAGDIIAEEISEDADLIEKIRGITYETGVLYTEAADPEEKTVYDMYYDRTEKVKDIPNHRVLAINRGEKERKLKVKLQMDADPVSHAICRRYIEDYESIYTEFLKATVDDSYKRLIAPSVERETRNVLTERAESDAVKVFAKNTENLLMAAPVKGKRIISIDPGYRTGCKVAVLGRTGKLLAYTTIYPTHPKNDVAGTERVLSKLIEKYKIDVIVIGNGTASRETEEVVAAFLGKNDYNIQYTIVNEAGASVYSASKLAAEEYPDLDVTTKGAMSLGRRLQDPLAELVKIDPKHIGVGQYQHDINQGLLDSALGNVVEDCVNRVGVDLNTASPSLLSYIAGINMGIAKNIVSYRDEEGSFSNRKELLKVKKLGAKTFEQCAGFMRISGGNEPLDGTSVHPESYGACNKLLDILGIQKENLTKGGVPGIEALVLAATGTKSMEKAVAKLAPELEVGELTLADIISELKKPGRDPRDSAPPVIFRKDVTSFEDLKEGMVLDGTIRNVVDFGAFVDIGVKQDGLVHISEIADQFVNNPMEVISVGDNVKVKIIKIDKEKKNIGLSMKGLNSLNIQTSERRRRIGSNGFPKEGDHRSENKNRQGGRGVGRGRNKKKGNSGGRILEIQSGTRLKSLKDLKSLTK
ncbi:MAG: Tex family protein [Clostridiales bacterium]|nr:Tex family protein [Clostridiales bacterium]MDY4061081.1 Tex family protein [Anaerovoracaceae bacterium]